MKVEMRGVAKRFGKKVVLDGIDLDITPGETLVLLGRSGTGKSVTLKLLLGLVKPDRGTIRIADTDIAKTTEAELVHLRRQMGMVFQGGALFDSMSVGENVMYGLREHFRWPEEKMRARARECLELVDLHGIERQEPGALSGGMRKRVAIARAIATSPELLLYDEPTTGLDPATVTQVVKLVRSLQERLGVTSLLVTHDMDAARAVADRMVLLERGRLAWTGTPADLADPSPPLVRFLGEVDEGDEWTTQDASR
jgi:phospholipid/cholesterol/gamma-HCH transport system ATP-binding protein